MNCEPNQSNYDNCKKGEPEATASLTSPNIQCCARQQKILTALASESPLKILIGVIYADNAKKC